VAGLRRRVVRMRAFSRKGEVLYGSMFIALTLLVGSAANAGDAPKAASRCPASKRTQW